MGRPSTCWIGNGKCGMNGTSSKIWTRSETDHVIVAPGFASASQCVAKRPRQGISHCFELINTEAGIRRA